MQKHLFKVRISDIRSIQLNLTNVTTSSSLVIFSHPLDFVSNYEDIEEIPQENF